MAGADKSLKSTVQPNYMTTPAYLLPPDELPTHTARIWAVFPGKTGTKFEGRTFVIARMLPTDFNECANHCAEAFVNRNAVVTELGITTQQEFLNVQLPTLLDCLRSGLSDTPPAR